MMMHYRRNGVMIMILLVLTSLQFGVLSQGSNEKIEPSKEYLGATLRSNRTAILLSGQVRSSNFTFTGGRIHRNRDASMFGPDDPPTPAGCIIKFLFESLAEQTGYDVFMFLTARSSSPPSSFEPIPGETVACEIFSNAHVFHGTGNRFFCLVEPEQQLMTSFLRNFTMWQSRPGSYNSERKHEEALQQYYGSYRANTAAKQYSVAHGVVYSHKIRLRPDTPLTRPFPNLTAFNFGPTAGKACDSTIFYPNSKVGGHNDWFNVGLTAGMDHLLDRYLDFTTTRFDKWQHTDWKGTAGIVQHRSYWDLEDHLETLLLFSYRICLEWYDELWMVVIRPAVQNHENLLPIERKYDWKELST